MLVNEVKRRDSSEVEFCETVGESLLALGEVFERNPRMAWVAKTMIEPERTITFRTPWIDDKGITRVSRGFRVQYSSALGPFTGSLHFGGHVNLSTVKALAFTTTIRNGLSGFNLGAAVGGSDFNPFNKTDAEVQRFCQSYMTELSKYIGHGVDSPSMGMGVGEKELGFMFGQFKRMGGGSREKRLFGLGEERLKREATGTGVAHFAEAMLNARNDTLKGKRCLIMGSGKVAMSLAKKLNEYGATPLSFSDSSGFIVEPEGFTGNRLKTIKRIKSERGARVGRYIISSTSAKFNESESIFDIPHDLVFPCNDIHSIGSREAVDKLVASGCIGIVEGGASCVSPAARVHAKSLGLLHAPSVCTLSGAELVHGLELENWASVTDEQLKLEMKKVFEEVSRTANEFNNRGDLFVGSNIAGFLRVGRAMDALGAI